MTDKITCLFLLLQGVISSCANSQSSQDKAPNTCALHIDLADSSLVKREYERLNKNNDDSCVVVLLDTLVATSIARKDVRYYECLELIRKKSDGHVSEYFVEVGKELFYNDFYDFMDYLFDNRKNKNLLENVLIESMSMEMAESNQPNKRKSIEAYIDSKIGTGHLTKEQIKYIRVIQSKFDPLMFE